MSNPSDRDLEDGGVLGRSSDVVSGTRSRVATIARERIVEVLDTRPRLTRAFWWSTLRDGAVAREWRVVIGLRDACGRIAHLLCELYLRLKGIGRTEDGFYSLPLTQIEIAETLGLRPVHVNRMVQQLRQDKPIELKGGILRLVDPVGPKRAAEFDRRYLHHQGTPEREPMRPGP